MNEDEPTPCAPMRSLRAGAASAAGTEIMDAAAAPAAAVFRNARRDDSFNSLSVFFASPKISYSSPAQLRCSYCPGYAVAASASKAIVETTAGKVRGYTRNRIFAFKGMPYADTTTGKTPVLCHNPVRIENVDVFVSGWQA